MSTIMRVALAVAAVWIVQFLIQAVGILGALVITVLIIYAALGIFADS